MHLRILIIVLIGIIPSTIFAQDTITFATATPSLTATPTITPTTTPIPELYIEPEKIIIQAEDGTFLVGDFYMVDPLSPTIMLFHQLYTSRVSWEPVIGPLLGAHYNVLAVDVRGYGDSTSSINWRKAIVDVQSWFNWVRDESGVRPDAISTMGSSMGSTLAIVGCANDALCKTAIAISPGWDYYGIELEDSLKIGLSNRPLMILYAERDRWPAIGMPLIEEAATGLISIEVFPANAHGMDLIKFYEEDSIVKILDWLLLYSGRF